VEYKPYKKLEQCIAAELKHMRKEAGYSSYENFALDNDLDRKHYWMLEKGHNTTIKTLHKVLKIHNIKFSTFFEKFH